MALKIGELAKRSGVTVRALHHYDSIGLLSPSARSDAGYRLYQRDDIARLHQIQALRRFGMALADIGTFLANSDSRLRAVVDQQIAALTRQIEQAGLLRDQLIGLQQLLVTGEEPELASWLTTLELMTMYDKYFTKDELARLPLFTSHAAIREWDQLIARVKRCMTEGVPATDPAVQQHAEHWMIMLERDTGGNADFVTRVNTMQREEPALLARNGITPALAAYVGAAFGHWRLNLYRPFLSSQEFDFMRANYGTHLNDWPPLVAKMRAQMDSGAAPESPEVRPLAQQWMTMFIAYAGKDPATHAKLGSAYQQEPRLLTGTFMSPELLRYVGQAIAASAATLR
ncbi:MAG TPA: MerR family transcriptional regulator [Telluria sp.]|jgi:DNA-binding transcriptional MerR regulator